MWLFPSENSEYFFDANALYSEKMTILYSLRFVWQAYLVVSSIYDIVVTVEFFSFSIYQTVTGNSWQFFSSSHKSPPKSTKISSSLWRFHSPFLLSILYLLRSESASSPANASNDCPSSFGFYSFIHLSMSFSFALALISLFLFLYRHRQIIAPRITELEMTGAVLPKRKERSARAHAHTIPSYRSFLIGTMDGLFRIGFSLLIIEHRSGGRKWMPAQLGYS